jgi:hypothetical protein
MSTMPEATQKLAVDTLTHALNPMLQGWPATPNYTG